MLKKLLITLFVLLILAAVGLAIFVLTFNAERYRPYWIQKLSEATGANVQLEKINLTWRKGFALEAKNFALISKAANAGDPAPLQVSSAAVAVEMFPLLRGKFQMGALLVDGVKIRLDRHADGKFGGVAALFEVAGSSGRKKSGRGAESFLALLISRLRIQNSEFIFHDEFEGAAREYRVSRMDLNLQNVSLLRPFPVQLKASLLSRKQNVEIQGQIHIRLAEKNVSLEGFKLALDLASLDPAFLAEMAPDLKTSGSPAGQLSAELADLVLERGRPADFHLQVRLADGRYADAGLPLPLQNIKSEALVKLRGMDLQSLSAELGSGHLAGSGHLDWNQPANLLGDFQIALSGADLAQLVPVSADSKEPRPQGTLSAGFKGTFAGSSVRVWSQTLAGTGQISVKDGIIENLNVTRELLGKLEIIPGISEKMSARLSQDYQKKLQQTETRFAPIEIPLRAAAGVLYADSISITSDTFLVNGGLQAALSGPVNGRFLAAIDPEFSAALMKSVRELGYLTDRQGQIVIPFSLQGTTAHPQLSPDLQDIASRMAVSKTQELISGMLTKKKTAAADSTAGTSTDAANSADPLSALLGQVLAGKKK